MTLPWIQHERIELPARLNGETTEPSRFNHAMVSVSDKSGRVWHLGDAPAEQRLEVTPNPGCA
jgi:hypothetical protein